MKRNSIILTVFVFLLLALVAMRYLPQPQKPVPAPTIETKPLNPSSAGEFRGFSLQLHASANGHSYKPFIDAIAKSGANTVCLVIHGYQNNASSKSIFIDSRKSPSDDTLRELLLYAKHRQLRTMLMPVVLLTKPRKKEWRGKIDPDDWVTWWNDYNSLILHYAKIAQQGKADIFSVGSELVSTENQTQRWKTLIAEVRNVYKGRLTYSANWDHYEVPAFWGDLDIIGMTSYFNLAKGDDPSLSQLKQCWAKIKKDIMQWQVRVNRPLLFTEVGWPNQVTAAEFPWNYNKSVGKAAPLLQARCFEAFFETWINEKAVAGFLVWEWPNQPGHDISPDVDTSYCPCGKPAMDVIQKFFQMPASPGNVNKPVASGAGS